MSHVHYPHKPEIRSHCSHTISMIPQNPRQAGGYESTLNFPSQGRISTQPPTRAPSFLPLTDKLLLFVASAGRGGLSNELDCASCHFTFLIHPDSGGMCSRLAQTT